MRKYHPGDVVTIRAFVAYNCMSPNVLGVKFHPHEDFNGATYVVSVNSIVSHEKVPLRKGDKVEIKRDHMAGKTFTIIEVYDEYAWIKRENSSPMTFAISDLERA